MTEAEVERKLARELRLLDASRGRPWADDERLLIEVRARRFELARQQATARDAERRRNSTKARLEIAKEKLDALPRARQVDLTAERDALVRSTASVREQTQLEAEIRQLKLRLRDAAVDLSRWESDEADARAKLRAATARLEPVRAAAERLRSQVQSVEDPTRMAAALFAVGEPNPHLHADRANRIFAAVFPESRPFRQDVLVQRDDFLAVLLRHYDQSSGHYDQSSEAPAPPPPSDEAPPLLRWNTPAPAPS